MGSKKLVSHGMMFLGLGHMPFALYLGFTQGMGPETNAFIMGILLFWGGFYLHREFGD